MSSLPPPPASILVPPLAGTDGGEQSGSSPPRSASPPSATAAAREPLSMETQLSMTDLVGLGSTNSSSEGTAAAKEQTRGCWAGRWRVLSAMEWWWTGVPGHAHQMSA